MKTETWWAVAARVNQSDKPWHLGWANEMFYSYEDAARRAFELNSQGYLHKPVRVTVAAVEDDVKPWDGVFAGAASVFQIKGNGQYTSVILELGANTLSARAVGLSGGTMMEAVRGYKVEE